jgi:hypothetical protein
MIKQIVFSWDELPGSVAVQYRQFRGTSRINLLNKSMFLHPKGEDVGYCEKCVMCHQSNPRRFHEYIKILLEVFRFESSDLFLRDAIPKIALNLTFLLAETS